MIVSLIVPFYHGNRYIGRILEIYTKNRNLLLLKSQADLELIIVNDSPDEEIHGLSNQNANNIWIVTNRKNSGIHQSRVNGLMASHGDYVLFLDQDDLLTDNSILELLSNIGDNDFIVSNGYKTSEIGVDVLYASEKQQKMCINKMCFYLYTCPIISPGQVLIKKSAIPSEWKSNTLTNNGADDYLLWLLMLEKGKKGSICTLKLYTHSYTGENASLNTARMEKSNFEVANSLNSIKVSRWKPLCIKRRAEYHCEYRPGIIHKIKYIDVCLCRFVFGKLFMPGK